MGLHQHRIEICYHASRMHSFFCMFSFCTFPFGTFSFCLRSFIEKLLGRSTSKILYDTFFSSINRLTCFSLLVLPVPFFFNSRKSNDSSLIPIRSNDGCLDVVDSVIIESYFDNNAKSPKI